MFAISDNLSWYDVAFWAGWAGVAAGAVASLGGLVDYLSIVGPRERAAATAHMLLNGGALVLFTAAGLISLDRGASEGAALAWLLVLQGTGLASLGIGGWLGGELVYRLGLAVHPAVPDAAGEASEERERARRRREARA